jgi:DDE superfamily endonuclease
MLPIVGVPKTRQRGRLPYRKLLGRAEGFEHVSRYVTGLILSGNKTLQGIYDGQVWEGDKRSRRAMHEAAVEAGWDADGLLPRHRAGIAPEHQGRGREVICLDWTLLHHERGPAIYGTTKSYDYVARRMGRFQPVVTAVVANRDVSDGLDLQIQEPGTQEEEALYLRATVQESYEQMAQARERVLELLHHLQHRLAYKKRTERVAEVVASLEEEGQFPSAHYAFDTGVLDFRVDPAD